MDFHDFARVLEIWGVERAPPKVLCKPRWDDQYEAVDKDELERLHPQSPRSGGATEKKVSHWSAVMTRSFLLLDDHS